MANTESIAAMRPEIWQKALYADAMDGLYFMKNGMMGKEKNNIIQIKDELSKNQGDTITFGLGAKLGRTTGVTGDGELEGNESKITYYSESVLIDQWRDAVRLTGKLDEQKNAFDMRMDAKEKLTIRMQEFLEMQFFLKLGGVTNSSITDIYGDSLGTFSDNTSMLTWSNTPNTVTAAVSAAGSGERYLCANSSGAASLTTSDKINPALISKLKVKAGLSKPKTIPLRVGGKNYYILFVHPWQAYDLKRNEEFRQAQREAAARGSENPIFTGAIGVWDGVVIHEHEYVPFLDVSVAGHNFASSDSGTDFAVDTFRAILCGQQAAGFAKCKTDTGWVEEKFNYKNQTGFATGVIGGIQKIEFNDEDYGVLYLDTYATDLS